VIADLSETESARRRTLLERAEQIAGIGSWQWSPATGELVWSDNVFRLMGLEPGTLAPSLALLRERTHPDDRERLVRELDAARHRGALPPIDLRIVKPAGEVRHWRATAGIEDRGPLASRRLLGAVQDITEQRHLEREVAAHLAVTEALAAWRGLEDGARRLLGDLAEALGFAAGTLWVPRGDVLVARIRWNRAGGEASEFDNPTAGVRLRAGTGLAGRAWARREPVDLPGPTSDPACRRGEAGTRLGPRGGIAVPAVTGDEVLAVVELLSAHKVELTERLTRLLTGVGYELGAFLTRRRGELGPPELTCRELEILQLAAHGVSGPAIAERLVISPGTVKTHFQHIYAKFECCDRASAVAHALRRGLIE
jgi:DNA-binding CsgD family transcriptional regulator